MTNLDNFKVFVKKNPILIKFVKEDKMTWQKFYEIYDLYGEDENAWGEYLNNNNYNTKNTINQNKLNFSEIVNMVKNMDVDKVQEGISSMQKVLGLFGDLFVKSESEEKSTYTPRQVYKRFED